MDNKKFKRLLIIGIVCLAVGIILFIVEMQGSNANETLITSGAMEGKSAQEVAQAFSANNQLNIWLGMISKFLLGFGLALSIVAGYKVFKEGR